MTEPSPKLPKLSRSTLQQLHVLAVIVAASAAAGGVYAVASTDSSAISWPLRALVGIAIGVVIATCLIGFQIWAARRLYAGGRRLPFAVAILARTVGFGAVIIVALVTIPWLFIGSSPSPFRPGIGGDIAFSIGLTFLFVFLLAIIQLIGPGVLVNLLTGRYYRPREEQRIVLFLDLVGSTSIAERMGNVGFHALLSDVFTRLSRVVTDHGGEVHRYVGDMLIATWPVRGAQDNARPIHCLFACQDTLEAARADLLARHGQAPGFRAGLHLGTLVAGEIGGFKQEITFIGDAMNTASRIEQACRSTGHAILASKPLVEHAALPRGVVATSVGTQPLRGKNEPLELFALARSRA
ncbi:MAG: adenylate/guanylate cyclase domain-containing protein [Candidatus Eiseniibacteriota bacterium]